MNKKIILMIARKAVTIGAPILSIIASFVERKQGMERVDRLIVDSVQAEVEKQLKNLTPKED